MILHTCPGVMWWPLQFYVFAVCEVYFAENFSGYEGLGVQGEAGSVDHSELINVA